MDTNESYELTAGSDLAIDATLRDPAGVPITDYAGTETLTTTVWPTDSLMSVRSKR